MSAADGAAEADEREQLPGSSRAVTAEVEAEQEEDEVEEDRAERAARFDPDDVEARLPPGADKGSLKGSVKVEDSILRLNIGGTSYRIRTRSVLKYGPTTLLGRLCRMDHEHRRQWADGYFNDSDEFFFERVPR